MKAPPAIEVSGQAASTDPLTLPESAADKQFGRRFLAIFTLAFSALMLGVWASGYTFLSVDYLARYYPFQAYPEYSERGHFIENTGVQDAILVYYTGFAYLHQQLQTGSIPLWNPLEGLGTPSAAVHASGFLFPVHWLTYGLFAPAKAWHLEIWLVGLVNIFSTFALFGRLSKSPRGAAIGSTAWVLGGWCAAYSMLPDVGWPLALFSMALLSVERFREGGRWATTQLALAVAGILLSGHLQLIVPATALTGIYILWRGQRQRIFLLGVLALGVVLALPHLIPLAELLSLSERQPHSLELALSALMVPREFLCMVFPTLMGKPSDGFYFGSFLASPIINGREHCVFVGVITLILALLGVFRTRVRSFRVIGAVITLGFVTAGAPWLYGGVCRVIPALLFLTPGRFLPYALFGVCLLACVGWASLESFPLRRTEAKSIAGLLVLVSLLALSFILPAMNFTVGFQNWLYELAKKPSAIKPPFFEGDFSSLLVTRVLDHFSLFEPTIAWSFFLVTTCLVLCWKGVGRPPRFGVIYSLLVLDLLLYYAVMNVPMPRSLILPNLPDVAYLAKDSLLDPAGPTPPGRVMALRQGPEPNLWLPYGINNLEAYESVHPGDFRAVIETINRGLSLPHQSCIYMGKEKLADGTLDLLGVNKLYNRHDQWDERYGSADFQAGVSGVYRNDSLRAYVIEKYEVTDRKSSLEAMMEETFDPRSQVLLNAPPSFASAAEPNFREVDVKHYSAHNVRLEIDQERPGILVLTDLYYPGWQARVNGRPVPLLKAHGFARAVELGAGVNKVELTFRPTGYRLTLSLVIVTLILLLGFDIFRHRRFLKA